MSLKELSIFEWEKKHRVQLRNIILEKLKEEYDISPDKVESILTTGSRTYKVDGVKVFNEDSDLDIIVLIETETYLEKKGKGKYPVLNFRDTAIRLRLYYEDVRCSVFVYPVDVDIYRFFNWKLPKVDLITLKVYGKFELDTLDYLMNAKGRIDPFKFCVVCKKSKDRAYLFSYTIVDADGKLDESRSFPICEDCMEKLCKYEDKECVGKYKIVKFFEKHLQGNILQKAINKVIKR